MKIRAGRIVLPGRSIAGTVEFGEDGRITRILENTAPADIDYGDLTVIPGIIDTHNHGAVGYRFDSAGIDGMRECLKGEAALGVTGILPTTTNYKTYPDLVKLMEENNDGARVLGIHSEGPWGSRVGEKGINLGYPSVDMELAKVYLEKGAGHLVLFDIAPEIPGALEAIDFFVSHGVTVANYHTNATYAEANLGIDHGVTVATHLFNVMTGLHHRDVGTAGASLLRDEVWCELICDGLHVCLPMVELALRMKDHSKIMMVSDNVAYAGAPVGKYDGVKMGNSPDSDRAVIEKTPEGYCLSKTGRLSGSSLPVVYGIRNLVKKLHMPLEEVVRMSSYNQSVKYGFADRGELAVGKFFDAVVIDDDFNVKATWVEGRNVFDSAKEKIPFNPEFLDKYYLG